MRPEFKICALLHRSYRFGRHRQGRTAQGLHGAKLPPGTSPKEAVQRRTIPKWKADQEKQRKEAAIANTTGIRILAAITAAVPVRLMKRDLLFCGGAVGIKLLDENRLVVVARQHGNKKAKDSDSIGKLFAAYLRRAEESALGRLLVEITILHTAMRQNAAQTSRDAATAYKVDVDAITAKVKQEFAAKVKAKLIQKAPTKVAAKAQTQTSEEGEGRIASKISRPEGVCHPAGSLFRAPVFPPWALLLRGRSDYARPPDGLVHGGFDSAKKSRAHNYRWLPYHCNRGSHV